MKVSLLYGELDLNAGNKNFWDKLLHSETGVIVSTARIALDAIIHAYLKLEDVSIIVFDEAHHAIGNNEYARIMAFYELVPKANRPKIFAMTASPLFSAGSLDTASTELERMLDSTIFTVQVSAREELAAFVARPTELVVEYDPTPRYLETAHNVPSVQAEVVMKATPAEDLTKVLNRMTYYWQAFGPLFSDLAWMASTKTLRNRASRKQHYADELLATESLVDPEYKAAQKFIAASVTSREVAGILDTIRLPEVVELNESNACPKLHRLVEVLDAFKGQADTFCGIIFCDRRLTALGLESLIRKTPRLAWIHPEALIGHGSNTESHLSDGMSWEEQCEILSRLRRRSPTNLVIATNVLEEGLDIMPVNCVVRFDLPTHHVGYVQSRGRARALESTFILLAEKNNAKHAALLTGIVEAEGKMLEWLASLPEDRVASLPPADAPEDEEEEQLDNVVDKRPDESYCDERTGARLWPADAPSLLAHYLALLRTDIFCPGGPEYEILGEKLAWRVRIRLPASCPIREHMGRTERSKLRAKRSATFELCVRLHQLNELDEHLAPRRKPKTTMPQLEALVGDFSNMGQIMDNTPENTFTFDMTVPQIFEQPGIPCASDEAVDVFVHVVRVPAEDSTGEAMRSIAFVTARPMPDDLPEVVFSQMGTLPNFVVPKFAPAQQVTLDPPQLQQVHSYNARLLTMLARRTFKYHAGKVAYLLLPLCEDGSIDWTEVAAALSSEKDVEPIDLSRLDEDGYFHDRIVLDNSDWVGQSRSYRFSAVDKTKTPLSLMDPDAPRVEGAEPPRTYWEHHKHFHFRNDAVKQRTKILEQPMITVKTVPRRLENYLTVMEVNVKTGSGKVDSLVPQLCFLHSIRRSTYEAARIIPSLAARLHQTLNAWEVNQNLFQGRLNTQEVIVALTAPTASHPSNYQRLEFLGDAYLKTIVSAYVFAVSDALNEGQLHLDRRAIVSNVGLIEKTKHLNLAKRLYTSCFTRRTWAPPFSVIEGRKEDPMANLQHVSAKMVADLVEALIGAAVETDVSPDDRSRKDPSWWMNDKLALQTVVDLDLLPAEMNELSSIYGLWSEQVEPKRIAENWDRRLHAGALQNLETLLGYQYRIPHLALEAMTHPGLIASQLPSYQRLEFLGDAVLDLFVDAWLYRAYPGCTEGQLTTLKGLAVSNQALGALCEHLKLYKFLQTSGQASMLTSIQEALANLQDARARLEKQERACSLPNAPKLAPNDYILGQEITHYWCEVNEIKLLSDIVESTLGAVFVDTGFNFAATWDFFRRLYLPWYQQYCHWDAFLQRMKYAQLKTARKELASGALTSQQRQEGK